MEIDPELIVPDPSLSLNDGAILPWSTSNSNYYEQMTQAIADKWEVDRDLPWEDLDEDVRGCFLYGTNGDRIYISYRNRYGAGARTPPPSRASSRTSSAATARPTRTGRARRSRST